MQECAIPRRLVAPASLLPTGTRLLAASTPCPALTRHRGWEVLEWMVMVARVLVTTTVLVTTFATGVLVQTISLQRRTSIRLVSRLPSPAAAVHPRLLVSASCSSVLKSTRC